MVRRGRKGGGSLFEHLQDQRFFDEAIHGAKGGEGALHGRGLAGFDGNDEWQRVRGIAGFLHDGANVDAFLGEGAGDFGNDAGTVDDGEADVVRNFELCAETRGNRGNLDAAGVVGEGEQIADDGDRGGMASGAVTGEDDIAAVVAGEDDHVLSAARPGEG